MCPDSGLALFALLAMGHFLGDFGLQNDRMAVEKCAGRDVTLPWQWWLTAHAAIHGLLVARFDGVEGGGLPDPADLGKVILVAAFGNSVIAAGPKADAFIVGIARVCSGGGSPNLAQAAGRDGLA